MEKLDTLRARTRSGWVTLRITPMWIRPCLRSKLEGIHMYPDSVTIRTNDQVLNQKVWHESIESLGFQQSQCHTESWNDVLLCMVSGHSPVINTGSDGKYL